MSLIRVRRRRKKEWIDVKRGKPPGKLILLLVLVIVVFWFLNQV